MLCWKCGQDMTVEHVNTWRKNKFGDRISSMTYVCWGCQTTMHATFREIKEEEE